MANIYRSTPGALVKSSVRQPSFLTVSGLDFGDKMIATNFKLDRGQDMQHQKTLSQEIYSYAFGEAMGRIQVGGMIFFGGCNGPSSAGVSRINGYYSGNNAFAKKSSVTCTIGGQSAFKCYLENLSILVEASAYNTGSFSLGFSVIPAGAKGSGGGGGGLSTGSL